MVATRSPKTACCHSADVPAAQSPTWKLPISVLYRTGPSATLEIDTDIKAQIEWLEQRRPEYLLTYPSNLLAIISELKQQHRKDCHFIKMGNQRSLFVKFDRFFQDPLHAAARLQN